MTGGRSIAGAAIEWRIGAREIAQTRSVLLVAVAQQSGEPGQARIDLVAAMLVVPAVEAAAAFDAQAGTVGATERMHRLGEGELVVEDRVEVHLVVLVDP